MKCIVLVILLIFAKQLFAQEVNRHYNGPVNREGFYIDIGFGVGYANRVNPLFYENENIFGTTFASNILYRFSSKVKGGVGAFLWAESGQVYHNDLPPKEESNNTRFSLMVTGAFYPGRNGRFFISTGIGAGNFFYTPNKALPLANGDSSLSSAIDVGLATALGLGYEIKAGKRSYLVPSINYYHTFLNNFEVFPGGIENSTPSRVIEFHLSFLFHAKMDD